MCVLSMALLPCVDRYCMLIGAGGGGRVRVCGVCMCVCVCARALRENQEVCV